MACVISWFARVLLLMLGMVCFSYEIMCVIFPALLVVELSAFGVVFCCEVLFLSRWHFASIAFFGIY